jgi:lipopolysaccharide export system protein LptA
MGVAGGRVFRVSARVKRLLLLSALVVLGGGLAKPRAAQPTGQAREFRLPLLSQNKQTGLLTGTGARTRPDGSVLLETARVEHYDPRGNTNANLLVLATNCVVDLRHSRVSSGDGLRVSTADGQLTLEGVGFQWSQDVSDLVVSNQIRTTVRKQPAAGAQSDTLTIEAGRLWLNYVSNVVSFQDHVLARDPELEVRCERLTVQRGATGKFDRLLAEQDVAILSRRDGSRATSDRAEYRLADGGEVVELTGRPRWSDAAREARADTFLLERATRGGLQTLRALGHASLKLPAGTNSFSGWSLLGPAPAPAAANPPADFIELNASALTLVLPPTNGPVRGVLAETNVVIRDTADGWRANAARAVFTNEVLELTGNPVWSAGGREVRGDALRLHTARQAVDVQGQARLRLPLESLGDHLPGFGNTNGPSARSLTNLVVQVESEAASFRTGQLSFTPPVRARLLEGDRVLGQLTGRELTVTYRERLEAVEAAGAVRLEQFARPHRRPLTRTIECERLRVDFAETGTLSRLVADGGVRGWQSEVRRPDTAPVVTSMSAGQVAARFHAGTNRLETATASGRVRIARDQRRAEGEEATYSDGNGLLALTGRPVVVTPEGRISDATSLTWDTRQGRARGRGAFRIEWTFGLTNRITNRLALPLSH